MLLIKYNTHVLFTKKHAYVDINIEIIVILDCFKKIKNSKFRLQEETKAIFQIISVKMFKTSKFRIQLP